MIEMKPTVTGAQPIRVCTEHLSKKYCTHLKRSLWYGVRDIAAEFNTRRTDERASLRPREFWALDDVSFDLRAGEALAVIGPNGAGKSTLLNLLSGLAKPDGGRITIHGRIGALIELGSGFSPALTGRENIYVNAALLGLPSRQVHELVEKIIEFADIGAFIDTPLGNYSSGMWVRLAYAISTHLKPDVLIVDEVLAVGDFAFQRKCVQHLLNYLADGGTLVLVTHNLYMAQNICTRSIVLDHGRIAFAGTAIEGITYYHELKAESQMLDAGGTTQQSSDRLDLDERVRIEWVTVQPVTGAELVCDAPARVIIRYRTPAEGPHVGCSFSFWTPDLLLCITGKWLDTKLHAGQGELSCFIPRLPLTAGAYAARVFVADAETGVPLAMFGWQTAPVSFKVIAAPSAVGNLHSTGSVLVSLEAHWEEGV